MKFEDSWIEMMNDALSNINDDALQRVLRKLLTMIPEYPLGFCKFMDGLVQQLANHSGSETGVVQLDSTKIAAILVDMKDEKTIAAVIDFMFDFGRPPEHNQGGSSLPTGGDR